MKKLILFTFTLTTIFAGELDFNHDGWDREAYYYKPSCLNDAGEDFEPIPLVFMIHGLGGVGADNYNFSAWLRIAALWWSSHLVCSIPGMRDLKWAIRMISMIIVILMH